MLDSKATSMLSLSIDMDEIKTLLFSMGVSKAIKQDGFQPFFLQSQWSNIGGQVFQFVKNILAGRDNIKAVNQSYIVLIPKVPKLETVS